MCASSESKTILVPCDRCGGQRNHAVLKEHVEQVGDDDFGLYEENVYQVCKCQGCDTVRFRKEQSGVEHDPNSPTVFVFPGRKQQRHNINANLAELPVVGPIYAETVAAFGADCLILAGGGLRATVEAICKEQKVGGKNLQEKIDALVSSQLLARPQADLLHEERYIGNTALHEVERPSPSDVSIRLEIVEGLLNTIYILPSKAEELRKTREGRAKTT